MTLVAGVDSSTQSCKVVVRNAETGELVRHGSAPHPPGTEVDPEAWWDALHTAIASAGGLEDVEALAVGGQQHGLVALDDEGRVIRPAQLWNDVRSAPAAEQLVLELGDGDREIGARRWAEAVGTVPVASLTVTKLRWLAEHEAENAARLAAVALPQYKIAIIQAKEATLKEDLFRLRDVLDQYQADKGSYPESLEQLVEENYLRQIPVDPMTMDINWETIYEEVDPDNPSDSVGIIDVKSASDRTSLSGTPYNEW